MRLPFGCAPFIAVLTFPALCDDMATGQACQAPTFGPPHIHQARATCHYMRTTPPSPPRADGWQGGIARFPVGADLCVRPWGRLPTGCNCPVFGRGDACVARRAVCHSGKCRPQQRCVTAWRRARHARPLHSKPPHPDPLWGCGMWPAARAGFKPGDRGHVPPPGEGDMTADLPGGHYRWTPTYLRLVTARPHA